jgi:hypothetical protein
MKEYQVVRGTGAGYGLYNSEDKAQPVGELPLKLVTQRVGGVGAVANQPA